MTALRIPPSRYYWSCRAMACGCIRGLGRQFGLFRCCFPSATRQRASAQTSPLSVLGCPEPAEVSKSPEEWLAAFNYFQTNSDFSNSSISPRSPSSHSLLLSTPTPTIPSRFDYPSRPEGSYVQAWTHYFLSSRS